MLFVVAVAGMTACDRGEPGAVVPPREPVQVETSAAMRGPSVAIHPATVSSTDEVDVATRISGTVLRVRVDVGSRVARGDTLVEVDATDVKARVESAEAAVRQARKYFQRIRNLEADGAATEQELDDARARLERAEAALREVRAQREYVVLRAPFPGTVTTRMADPGDLAVPGRPVLGLVRPESLEITAHLPGEVGKSVRQGDRFRVRDPETGTARDARVTRVSPARDRGSRRIRIELSFVEDGNGTAGEPGLVPGAFARLEREDPETRTLWIPRDAVVRRGQLTGIYAVVRDSLDLRWVRLGMHRGDAVEVLAGLESGDRVVRDPRPEFADGVPVQSGREVPWKPGTGGDGR